MKEKIKEWEKERKTLRLEREKLNIKKRKLGYLIANLSNKILEYKKRLNKKF